MKVTEKDRRMYYQNILYHVCLCLDRIDNKSRGNGIVCGCIEAPSTEVQERMDKLVEGIDSLKEGGKDGDQF